MHNSIAFVPPILEYECYLEYIDLFVSFYYVTFSSYTTLFQFLDLQLSGGKFQKWQKMFLAIFFNTSRNMYITYVK